MYEGLSGGSVSAVGKGPRLSSRLVGLNWAFGPPPPAGPTGLQQLAALRNDSWVEAAPPIHDLVAGCPELPIDGSSASISAESHILSWMVLDVSAVFGINIYVRSEFVFLYFLSFSFIYICVLVALDI